MKKLKFYAALSAMIFAAFTLASCEDESTSGSGGDGGTDGGTGGGETSSAYFDVWVEFGSTGNSMGTGGTILVNSYESLEDVDQVVNFVNDGADVSSILHDETLTKDGYYYQIPQTEGRFGKYKIADDMCGVVKEVKLPDEAVLAARKYCGAWIDDDTLVIMGSINSYQDIAWVKINTTDMSVEDSGTLALDMDVISWPNDAAGYTLSTSGLVGYREADDRLIYSYSVKRAATADTSSKTSFDVCIAFIDPSDMSIKQTAVDSRVEQTSGTAFGELLQTKTFFADNGDYYIACINSTNITTDKYQSGFIRIKAGETEVDSTYKGLYELNEKILTFSYLGGNELLIYSQNPSLTDNDASDWSSSLYSCYYSIWNFADDTRVELEYDGEKLPYCTGSLTTQLFTYADGKAYLGINSEEYVGIYVYDVETKSVSLGSKIASGYELTRIIAHEEE